MTAARDKNAMVPPVMESLETEARKSEQKMLENDMVANDVADPLAVVEPGRDVLREIREHFAHGSVGEGTAVLEARQGCATIEADTVTAR